jgi:hypothetical protein
MSAQDPGSAVSWVSVAKVLGAVAAGSLWVSFIGAVIMWERLNHLDVAPTPGVAALPKESLVIVGTRVLAVPLLAGLAAFVFTVVWPRRATVTLLPPKWQIRSQPAEPPADAGAKKSTLGVTNVKGEPTPGLQVALFLLTFGALLWWLFEAGNLHLEPAARWVLLPAILVAPFLAYMLVIRSEGTAQFTGALFIGVSVFGALVGFVVASFQTTARMDLAVVVTDKSAYSGYYLAQSGDTAYLIVAAQPAGVENNVVRRDEPFGPVRIVSLKCADPRAINVARPASRGDKGGNCYTPQILAVKGATQVYIGPRDVAYGPQGFTAARVLAQVALTGEISERDGRPAPPQPAAAK